MLETFRQYGAEQLTPEEVSALRDRHLQHYLAVAEAADLDFRGRAYPAGRRTFTEEWDNIRAADEWAATSAQLDPSGRLLAAI